MNITGLIIPVNGALMSDEQYAYLCSHVGARGTELEKAMLHQMNAMITGVNAWKRSRNTEWTMRLEVETELREVRVKARKARTILSTPTSKLTKADLLKMVKDALAELPDEVEVE